MIARVADGLRLFDMQPVLSSSNISSSMNFWHLSGMKYSLHAIGGPLVEMSISNSSVLPTSVDAVDTVESNLFCNSEESLLCRFLILLSYQVDGRFSGTEPLLN